MVLRTLALTLGVVELLRPKQVVDFWMRLATRGDATPRRWVYAAARVEGLSLVLWALTRRSDGGD
ncbi:hypothetical protein NDI76_12245 [Halogeometricum sp. S1BR25-6]|uniref:Uncharacterized protein n=1 Tax=Halogeometricum salsisoli TaxID=2950536 RepID=A0ABU2GHE7_9EURY|nr:hypothetical protein [Halogeometricum sp. S1BR25-6]MDS0299513.1 hypothetical protein [Halogeometricum sp. S1BR25-6]